MAFMGCYRTRGEGNAGEDSIGAELKQALTEAGSWGMYMYMQGETVPKYKNRVYLSETAKDQWGIPLLVTDLDYDHNDDLLLKDFLTQGAEMLEAAGVKNIHTHVA